MDALDSKVAEWCVREFITRDRVEKVLEQLLQRRLLHREQLDDGMENLKQKREEADTRLRRLYDAIENGLMDIGEPDVKERLDAARKRRDAVQSSLDAVLTAKAKVDNPSPAIVDQFLDILRENLVNGSVSFRRAYLKAVLNKIIVYKDEAQILDCEGGSSIITL